MFHIKKSSNSTIHVHDVFMHIPDFFARTWQWEHPVTRPCCNKKTTEAQLHWDGTQPFTQVVDKLTTAHLEDEMHRRFLLHLVRISGKCTNGKSQTKTYNGQDPRSKVGLWKTNLFFFARHLFRGCVKSQEADPVWASRKFQLHPNEGESGTSRTMPLDLRLRDTLE